MRLLLHSCCAPCSAAILEWLLERGVDVTVFYFNPNIFPRKEYEHRKEEAKRYCQEKGVPFVDADYDHEEWVAGLREQLPTWSAEEIAGCAERGARCGECFFLRLRRAAEYAEAEGFDTLATTLASSRWKRLEQIAEAGERAVAGTSVNFWAQNWRKGGLQERRNALLKENGFYNQLYCGCEYSFRRLGD